MACRHRLNSHLLVLSIAFGTACGRPPLADPKVASSQGVAFGRVQVFSEGKEQLASDCSFGLSDERGREIRHRPTASGWLFASFPKGEARISSVDCGVRSRVVGLDFDVPGDGRTTYFGHVRLDLRPETRRVAHESGYVPQRVVVHTPPPPSSAGGGGLSPGAAVAVGVGVAAIGVAAILLLSDEEAVGLPTVDVEDKTYDAVAAYQARFGHPPKALVISLAGSTFSSDVAPFVQKKGGLIFTEASVSGVRLTWLGVSTPEQPKAALRVQRFVRKDAPCSSIKLVLDGLERVVPAVSKSGRASSAFKQTVQAEMDLRAIQDIAKAKRVVVDVCGTTRAFSALASGATKNFATAYQELAKAAPPPSLSPPGAAPASAIPLTAIPTPPATTPPATTPPPSAATPPATIPIPPPASNSVPLPPQGSSR